MMKKIVAILLAGLVAAAFAGCKKDEQPNVEKNSTNVETPLTDDNTQENESVEIDYLADLSTERYDGYNYRMLVRAGHANTQWFEDPQEDIVDNAIYNRNKLVEEKYGITITVSEASGDYQTDALNSILAGDDAYDIIFSHSRAAFVYAIQGAGYNIHDIPTIHLEKPWWSKDLVESCTIGDNLYVLDGDISITGLSLAMCVFFNKNIFDELGFDYPYETVLDGEWTFDEFSYYAKKGGKDLNGDGVIKGEDDRFGFTTSEWSAPINILYASGEKVYDKNDDGKLELTLYSNRTVQVFDAFFRLMENEACFLQVNEGTNAYTGTDIFGTGRSMMTSLTLGAAQTYRNMEDDFGIIPYPKFDETDDYSTAVNGAAPLITIPITVSDVARTGAITEALCAIGSRDVIPAFYEKSLKTKYSRDEDSEVMMDIIKDSIIYDIGYVAGGPFQSTGHDLVVGENNDFASFYAMNELVATQKLDDFNRDYGGFEN